MRGERLTWLSYSPVIFPGFNGSLIDPSVYIDHWVDEGYSYADFQDGVPDGFWNAYMNMVGERAAELIDVAVKKLQKGIILNAQFKELWSPNSYNTPATDRLFLTLEVRKDKLENWILQHSRQFCDYLANHWTSHEGFTSIVPNTLVGLFKSPFREKITLEYFIREACLRLGWNDMRDMEGRLYSFITEELDPALVEEFAYDGNVKPPVREGMVGMT